MSFVCMHWPYMGIAESAVVQCIREPLHAVFAVIYSLLLQNIGNSQFVILTFLVLVFFYLFSIQVMFCVKG